MIKVSVIINIGEWKKHKYVKLNAHKVTCMINIDYSIEG